MLACPPRWRHTACLPCARNLAHSHKSDNSGDEASRLPPRPTKIKAVALFAQGATASTLARRHRRSRTHLKARQRHRHACAPSPPTRRKSAEAVFQEFTHQAQQNSERLCCKHRAPRHATARGLREQSREGAHPRPLAHTPGHLRRSATAGSSAVLDWPARLMQTSFHYKFTSAEEQMQMQDGRLVTKKKPADRRHAS